MSTFGRRSFILQCVAAATAGGLLARVAATSTSDAHDLELDAFASLIDGPSAVVVGRVYLRDHPEEAGSCNGMAAMLHAPPTVTTHELADRFARAIRDDFDRGDVVAIDGWMLARTEARLCAWRALHAAG